MRTGEICQWFGNTSYRLAARTAARLLGRHEIVRSVYVRRSVAAGEVSFGRSDIDLTIVLRESSGTPEEAERILALTRTYRALRVAIPVLGESFVLSPEDLRRAYRADPYRASLDRRCAIWLYGSPVEIPDVALSVAGSARRVIGWFSKYLPQAMRTRNHRNLEKFAIEIWNATATLTGFIREPYLTRRETLQAWRRSEPELDLTRMAVSELFQLCCRLAGEAHAACRAPLAPLGEPLIIRRHERQYVIIPSPEHPIPNQRLDWNTTVGTPEVMDLYCHYHGAHAYAELNPEIARLGIEAPGYDEWMDSCRAAADPWRLRTVGFLESAAAAVATARAFERTRRALEYLEKKELPPGEVFRKFHAEPVPEAPSTTEYYREWYPRLHRGCRELWKRLDRLPCSEPSVSPPGAGIRE